MSPTAAADAGSAAAVEGPDGHGLVSWPITDREGAVDSGGAQLERRFKIRTSGRVVELSSEGACAARPKSEAKRGRIEGFSSDSRRRLLRACAEVPWAQLRGTLLFVTLTYPGGTVPTNSAEAKRHLQRFRARWERKFRSVRGMWKQEFQRRGAVHFHLALLVDGYVNAEDLKRIRKWAAQAWYEVVGSGDERHLRAGTQVQHQHGNLAGYFAKYAASPKDVQHQLPEAWDLSGRWWGRWNVKAEWESAEVSCSTWCELRRTLRRSLAAKVKRRQPVRAQLVGLWVMAREEGGWRSLLDRYAYGVAPPGGPGWEVVPA